MLLGAPRQTFPVRSIAISAPVFKERVRVYTCHTSFVFAAGPERNRLRSLKLGVSPMEKTTPGVATGRCGKTNRREA